MPQGMRALSDLFVGFLPTIIFVSSLPDVIYFCYTPFPIWQCLLFASPLSEFMFCCAGIAFFFFFCHSCHGISVRGFSVLSGWNSICGSHQGQ